MQSINFNTGYKTYAINEDESNVIRLNLADQNLLSRAEEVLKSLEDFKSKITEDMKTQDIHSEFDKMVKEKIDYAFGQGTSQAAFGNVNCLTVADDDGNCIFETFMNAIMPILYEETAAAAKKQKKHISDMIDKGKLDKYINDIKGAV